MTHPLRPRLNWCFSTSGAVAINFGMSKKPLHPGADRWWMVLRDLQANWRTLERHLAFPPRGKPGTRGRPREFDLRGYAEAFLLVAYRNLPLREPAGASYPTPSPLIRALNYWIETGQLEAFWKTYIKLAGRDCVAAWHRALNEPDSRQSPIRRHAYWHVMMRMVVHTAVERRHIKR